MRTSPTVCKSFCNENSQLASAVSGEDLHRDCSGTESATSDTTSIPCFQELTHSQHVGSGCVQTLGRETCSFYPTAGGTGLRVNPAA